MTSSHTIRSLLNHNLLFIAVICLALGESIATPVWVLALAIGAGIHSLSLSLTKLLEGLGHGLRHKPLSKVSKRNGKACALARGKALRRYGSTQYTNAAAYAPAPPRDPPMTGRTSAAMPMVGPTVLPVSGNLALKPAAMAVPADDWSEF